MQAKGALKFTKMQGLGNDFILVENWDKKIEQPAALARRICARRLSAGADGLMLIEPSAGADARMHFLNADGSEAEMCGNGLRCFARYLYDSGMVRKEKMRIQTGAGIVQPEIILRGGAVAGVRVEMGSPEFCPEKIPVRGAAWGEELALSGKKLRFYAVRMGVPHAVLLVEDAADPEWMRLGAKIEANTALFPERINVNFVQVISKSQAAIRTYERGAGPTLACGTGSCAAAVVLHKLGLCRAQVEMLHAPGTLLIELQGEKVFMQGPAEYVYQAELMA